MKADSLLKGINVRVKEVGNFFGHQSMEYQDLQSIILAAGAEFSGFDSILVTPPGKPRHFSRSKRVIQAVESNLQLKHALEVAYEKIKQKGTVEQMALNYISNEFDKKNWKSKQNEIKQKAKEKYDSKFDDTDRYSIEESGDFLNAVEIAARSIDDRYVEDLAEVMRTFHESPGRNNPSGKNEKWERIKQKFREAKERHERWLAGDIEDGEEEDD